MVAPFGEAAGLVEVAERPVRDPQARPGHGRPRPRQGARDQADVVGLAVGVGGQRHRQAVGRQVGHQQLAAVEFAGPAAAGQQALGGVLDLLAIEDHDGQAGEAGGQGAAIQAGGEQRPQPRAQAGEEGLRQGQRQAGPFAVDGPGARGQPLVSQGLVDGRQAAAAVAGDGVGEDRDEFREGEWIVVAAAAVLPEEGLQDRIGGEVGPHGVEGFRQGEALQDFPGEGVLAYRFPGGRIMARPGRGDGP
jgi:hypothetical protein